MQDDTVDDVIHGVSAMSLKIQFYIMLYNHFYRNSIYQRSQGACCQAIRMQTMKDAAKRCHTLCPSDCIYLCMTV